MSRLNADVDNRLERLSEATYSHLRRLKLGR